MDAAYSPGQRGLWLKTECLHREEFVVIGWTNPEGSRPFIGALLLAYYDPDGRLIYAGGRLGNALPLFRPYCYWAVLVKNNRSKA